MSLLMWHRTAMTPSWGRALFLRLGTLLRRSIFHPGILAAYRRIALRDFFLFGFVRFVALTRGPGHVTVIRSLAGRRRGISFLPAFLGSGFVTGRFRQYLVQHPLDVADRRRQIESWHARCGEVPLVFCDLNEVPDFRVNCPSSAERCARKFCRNAGRKKRANVGFRRNGFERGQLRKVEFRVSRLLFRSFLRRGIGSNRRIPLIPA